MSIDALTITPNPVNAQQTFVISVEATPEEIPTPETQYKLGTVVVYSAESSGKNGLIDEDTSFGHYIATNSTSNKPFIIRGFPFPELSGHTIVGAKILVNIQNYTHYGNSTQGTCSFSLITGIVDGTSDYTSLTNSYSVYFDKRYSYWSEHETDLITDNSFLTFASTHMNDIINGTVSFGVRGVFTYAEIAYVKLKFYYM